MPTLPLENEKNVSKRPNRSLRKNSAWMLFGSIVYAACQWGMIGTLAKTTTPEVVGHFALAMAVTNPIILLATLNLRAIQATEVHHEFEFADYMGLRIIALTVACLMIAAIALGAGYSAKIQTVIAMVTAAKVFDTLSDTFYGLAQKHERMDFVATSRIVQGLLQFAFFALIIILTGNLVWATFAMALASGATTAIYDIRFARRLLDVPHPESQEPRGWIGLLPRWTLRSTQRLFWIALPLGLASGMWNLNANIPRYIIQNEIGDGALGIFASLSQIMIIGTQFIMGTVVQASSPRLAHLFLMERREFFKLFFKVVAVGFVGGILAVITAAMWGRPLLTLLYNAEYGKQPAVFTWLMVGTAIFCVALAFEGGLLSMRRFSSQSTLSLVVTACTAIACGWLIPRHGLLGAAWATDIGLTVKLLGNILLFFGVPRFDRHPTTDPINVRATTPNLCSDLAPDDRFDGS